MHRMTINYKDHDIALSLNSEKVQDSKTSLLMVHGNSSSKSAFDNLMNDQKLSEKFNLIAVDLPGHGDSQHFVEAETNPEIYTVPFYADALNEVIKQLNLNQITALGHSLGAHITTALSKRVKLQALVNIQNTPINTPADVASALSQAPVFLQLFNPNFTEESLIQLSQEFFNESSPDYFVTDFKATDPNCRKNLLLSLQNGLVLNEVEYLRNIDIPFQLIIGIKDSFTNSDYIKKLNYNDSVYFIESLHFPMAETPEIITQSLLKIHSS